MWLVFACTAEKLDSSPPHDSWTPDSDGWVDADGDGYSPLADELTDCDDADPDEHPGADEVCDGEDDDCDGAVDEDLEGTWYADADGDGYGDATVSAEACGGAGWTDDREDCDDADPEVHPGADDICDERDNDCDGRVDEDEVDAPTWYRDADGDGVGDAAVTRVSCTQPSGYVEAATDCDDTDVDVHPGAEEACDGRDDDCDGALAADEVDGDGDSQLQCDDCDDTDATRWYGAVELCDDAVDNDCDGTTDSDCAGCDAVVATAASSVQDAIDLASDGDLLCLGADTWYESIDFRGKDLTVLGLGPDLTALDGSGVDRVVTFANGETAAAVLSSLTVQNGYVEYDDAGGVLIDGASPTLEDLVVVGNESAGWYYGGGIYVDGGSPTFTRLIVQDNLSMAWSEYHYGKGGGVALVNADAVLDDVVMTGNQAGWSGSGLYLEDSSAAIFATDIRDNGASQHGGGGVYVLGGAPTFENVRISGNSAVEEYGVTWGGGLWLDETDATFTNVAISDNTSWGISGSYAGGVYVEGGAPTFTNVVIEGNNAETEGGGAYGDRTGTFRYSDLYGNSPDDVAGFPDPTGSDGNVSVAPSFLDSALHLDGTSALIDAGDPAILDPDGSTSDIGWFGGSGADEIDLDGDGWPSWWLPGSYDAATSPTLDCDDDDAAVYPGSGC